MDLSPRSLSRALPWLAAALAIEGVFAIGIFYNSSGISGFTCMSAIIHVPQIAMLLVFAGAVKVMTAGGAERIPCQRLQWGAFACIIATAVARYVDVTVDIASPRGWLFFHAGSSALTALALPGLWGCALARLEDLGSERITGFARFYGRAAFAGMGCLLLAEGFAIAALGPIDMFKSVRWTDAVNTVLLLPTRVCLLLSAWDAWKPAVDEVDWRARAQRNLVYLPVAALASSAASILTGVTWYAESHHLGYIADSELLVWHGFVQLTLALMTAILVSRALEAPERLQAETPPPFVPEPERPRDTGPIDVP